MTAEEAAAVQTKLAQIILASACTGERDMERLRDIALRGLSGTRLVEVQERLEHCVAGSRTSRCLLLSEDARLLQKRPS